MASTSVQILNVACLKNGASPTPVASKQPLAWLSDTSLAGCIRQKRRADKGLMDARVSVAMGPLVGTLAVTSSARPDHLPLHEYALSLAVQNSRERLEYERAIGDTKK